MSTKVPMEGLLHRLDALRRLDVENTNTYKLHLEAHFEVIQQNPGGGKKQNPIRSCAQKTEANKVYTSKFESTTKTHKKKKQKDLLTFSAYLLWSSCIPDSSQWSLKPCSPIFLSSTVSSCPRCKRKKSTTETRHTAKKKSVTNEVYYIYITKNKIPTTPRSSTAQPETLSRQPTMEGVKPILLPPL